MSSSSLLLSSSRMMSRRVVSTSCRRSCRGFVSARTANAASSSATSSSSSSSARNGSWALVGAAATMAATAGAVVVNQSSTNVTSCSVPIGTGIIAGNVLVKEPATGITFPNLLNGMTLAGVGVRVKWAFVKVYAVGTYLDPLAMSAVKSRSKEEIAEALLNPTYPRTIRIVLNRELTSKQYTDAILEALEPRMHGKDLFALEEFKKLNPDGPLIKGAEILMTIRGDTILYESPSGTVGTIRSEVFTKAMCDVYFGNDPVSPAHKEDVIKGIPKNM